MEGWGQSTCCGCSAARSPSASSLVTHFIRSSVQWLATPPLHSRARHFRDRKNFLHFSDYLRHPCRDKNFHSENSCDLIALRHIRVAIFFTFFKKIAFTLPKMKKFWKYIYAWKKFPCDIYFQARFIYGTEKSNTQTFTNGNPQSAA